jgi:hypothetical protein
MLALRFICLSLVKRTFARDLFANALVAICRGNHWRNHQHQRLRASQRCADRTHTRHT